VSPAVWIGVGGVVWLILAVAVALLIGGLVRRRDSEVPRPEQRPRRFRAEIAHDDRREAAVSSC
jgi:hypothetical protein